MGKSGAEAVCVYATQSQCATRQSQRLRLCRAIKSRTRATKSRDKITVVSVTSVLGPTLTVSQLVHFTTMLLADVTRGPRLS